MKLSLFGKKKHKDKDSKLPELPDLPDFPGASAKSLNFPKFESSHSDTKFMPPSNLPKLEPLNLSIPKRQKNMPKLKPLNTTPQEQFKPMPKEFSFKEPREFSPQPQEFERPALHHSKPIYIQIHKFQEAAKDIDKIKEKIHQADSILEEISRLRAEEDKELELWHADINSIKEKLLRVDKSLFGDA